MNFNLTIGVTPELANLLGGLTQALQNASSGQAVQAEPKAVEQSAPVQTQQIQPEPPVAAVPVTPPPAQQQPAPQQSAVPTSVATYSMDQLAVAATQLVDQGKRDALLQLLSSFGAQALTQLPQEQYGAFATKLRELGAQI